MSDICKEHLSVEGHALKYGALEVNTEKHPTHNTLTCQELLGDTPPLPSGHTACRRKALTVNPSPYEEPHKKLAVNPSAIYFKSL